MHWGISFKVDERVLICCGLESPIFSKYHVSVVFKYNAISSNVIEKSHTPKNMPMVWMVVVPMYSPEIH